MEHAINHNILRQVEGTIEGQRPHLLGYQCLSFLFLNVRVGGNSFFLEISIFMN